MAYKCIIMTNMKCGKSNYNSRTNTNGGKKDMGKRKKVVYSQANEPTAGVRNVEKQDKDSEILSSYSYCKYSFFFAETNNSKNNINSIKTTSIKDTFSACSVGQPPNSC